MPSFLADIRSWLVAIVRWLVRPWRAWGTVGVVVGTVGVVVGVAALSWQLPGTPEDRVRYCGLALQLLGVATVVALLQDKRRTFSRQSLVEQFTQWLAVRPRFRPKAQTISMSGASSSSAIGSATLSIWRHAAQSAPVEDRVTALEGNIETLKQDIESATKRAVESAGRLATELNAERQAREATDSAIRSQIEKFAAGGLHIEATGLVWLIFGIVLATIPTELAKLLQLIK